MSAIPGQGVLGRAEAVAFIGVRDLADAAAWFRDPDANTLSLQQAPGD